MKKIDITEWKEFEIKELFTINPTKYHRLTNKDLMQDDGENPVIVNSSFNNGIGGYTNYELTEKGNVITFSDTTTSDSIFYQPNDFVGYSHVQVVKPISNIEKWNRYSLLFFTAIFKKKASLMNYDYVNKFTRADALKLKVKLPIDNNGELNWEYMESFIKRLETRERESTSNLTSYLSKNKSTKIDVSNWKKFEIEKLFIIERPQSRSVKKYMDGEVSFVSSGNYNNGVDSYKKPIGNEELDKGNCITVSPVDGSTFYQPQDFLGRGGGGSSIMLLYNKKLNRLNGLFIASVIEKSLRIKYQYNDMGSSESIKKEKIFLPAINNEIPDWDYMERYIENLKCKIANYNI
jgi:hypothetical protein